MAEKKPIVITCSNIKGGVAKTTTAATIAAGLNKKGARVLMIDVDPQSNLTMCFIDEPEEGSDTIYKVFKEVKKLKDVRVKIKEGLDLVPGDLDLCAADMEFLGKPGCFSMLGNMLKGVAEDYDYVVMDTPPNLGFLSLNAFYSSDYIVTPMAADSFSLRAIKLQKKTLDAVSRDKKGAKVKVAGVLLTKYTSRTNISKALEENVKASARLLNTKLFNSRIRQATVVQESQLVKKDLFEYAPKAPVTQDYEKFLIELLNRIGGLKWVSMN